MIGSPVRTRPRPQPPPLSHRPRQPRSPPQTHRRRLATTARLRRHRHRMAARLPPPRLARKTRPPPRTPPAHRQGCPQTDPRPPSQARPLGRRRRRPQKPRRTRTTLTAPRHIAATPAQPRAAQPHPCAPPRNHKTPTRASSIKATSGEPAESGVIQPATPQLWNSRWNTPNGMGGTGFEPV